VRTRAIHRATNTKLAIMSGPDNRLRGFWPANGEAFSGSASTIFKSSTWAAMVAALTNPSAATAPVRMMAHKATVVGADDCDTTIRGAGS